MIATRARWALTPTEGADRAALIEHLDAVMEALLDLEEQQDSKVHSAAISFDAKRHHVLVELAVNTTDHAVADVLAAETLRDAVQRAGGDLDPEAILIARKSALVPA